MKGSHCGKELTTKRKFRRRIGREKVNSHGTQLFHRTAIAFERGSVVGSVIVAYSSGRMRGNPLVVQSCLVLMDILVSSQSCH